MVSAGWVPEIRAGLVLLLQGNHRAALFSCFLEATKKLLPIPRLIDDCTFYMGGSDKGDQMRAQGSTPPATKGWKALFYYSIQLALCNAYLISTNARVDPERRYDKNEALRRDVAAAFI